MMFNDDGLGAAMEASRTREIAEKSLEMAKAAAKPIGYRSILELCNRLRTAVVADNMSEVGRLSKLIVALEEEFPEAVAALNNDYPRNGR